MKENNELWLNPHINQKGRFSIQNFHILPRTFQILAKSAIFAKTGLFLGFSSSGKKTPIFDQ